MLNLKFNYIFNIIIMNENTTFNMEERILSQVSSDELNEIVSNYTADEDEMLVEWSDNEEYEELDEELISYKDISSYDSNSDFSLEKRSNNYVSKSPSTVSHFFKPPCKIRCLGEVELSRSSRYLNPFNFFPLISIDVDLTENLYLQDEPPLYDDIGVERYLDLVKEYKAETIPDIINQLGTDKMNLKYYGLTSRSYIILLEVLKYNKHVKHLDLTNNEIDSVDAANIFSDMIKENKTLESINLSHCNIGPEKAKIIFQNLVDNKNLNELILSHCNIEDAGCIALADELGFNTGLRKLDLSFNNLSSGCYQELGDAIFDNNDLMELNISGNNFNVEGFRTIVINLRDNFAQKLQRISFANCGLGTQNDKSLKLLVTKVSGLKYLDLSRNRIQSTACDSIVHALRRNNNLIEVNLAYNPLSTEDLINMMENLKIKVGRKLQVLDLTDKYMPKIYQEIVEKLKKKVNIIFRGYLCNYIIEGPDMKLLFVKRLKAICEPKRTKLKNRDKFGSFFYDVNIDYIPQQNWINIFTSLCDCPRLSKDKEFLKGLAKLFTDETKKINIGELREMYLATFPNTKKPPSKEETISEPKAKKEKAAKEKKTKKSK